MPERKISTTFEAAAASPRVDVFLTQEIPDVSRRKAREACGSGKILLNGRPANSGEAVLPGDIVTVVDFQTSIGARPELAKEQGGPLVHMDLIYEDEDVLIVGKRRGMPTVTLRPDDTLTLADCIAAYCPDCAEASADPRESGLVQRLDNWTSGLLVAAKKRAIWQKLRAELFQGRMIKTYVAFVEGELKCESMPIRLALLQAPDGKGMVVAADRDDDGETNVRDRSRQEALTMVTTLRALSAGSRRYTVVLASGMRMKRHQIRAHLAAVGHPLVGDEKYGAKMRLQEAVRQFPSMEAAADELKEGFLLHAETLFFMHPTSGKQIRFAQQSRNFMVLLK